MNEHPTPQQEIDRKIVEHLTTLVDEKNRGILTGSEFRAAVRALYAAGSGIMSGDIAGLVVAAADSVAQVGYQTASVYLSKTEMRVVVRHQRNGGVTILNSIGTLAIRNVDTSSEDDPALAGHNIACALHDRLTQGGFVQLIGEKR